MLKLGTKRPKQERSKSTVDAILEAVTHIMDKDGAQGLTTNKIAERAGVSVGSLYQYFKNKESIFETILLRMTETNLALFESHLAAKPETVTIEGIVRLVVQSQFENIQKMGKLSKILFEYAPQLLSHQHFNKADESIIRFLLDKTQEYNVAIKPENKAHAFFVCSNSVRGVIFMTILTKPVEEQQAIVNELINMLTSYLMKK